MKSVAVVCVSVVLFLSIGSSLGQIISTGQCREPVVVQNFNLASYSGAWYEVARYEQMFQRDGECVTSQYTLNSDGSSLSIQHRMLVPPSSQLIQISSQAVLSFPDQNPLQGKLNISYGGQPATSSNYWVLDTDYTSFSFIWSCFQVSDTIKGEYHWLLSRTVELSASAQQRVDELSDAYLNRNYIRPTQHDLEYCVTVKDADEEIPAENPVVAQEVAESAKLYARVAGLRNRRLKP
ncbi:lazarillo protein-like [Armigeres subalbatus]|uniref:lazarillo protein-like n=1 Tax=Armigeres subalbatus TaxID=124917 RepID=UPI002ED4249E